MDLWKPLAAVVGFIMVAALVAGCARWALYPRSLAELGELYELPNAQFAEIDGVRVHYAEDGPADSPCLVLLQGDHMNLRVWDETVAALKSHFHILRVDLLTQGLTGPDAKGDYSEAHDQRIVEAVVQRANPGRCSLAGSTDGGRLAYRYAAAHPDKVDRLVLIDSAGAPGIADVSPPEPWAYDRLRQKLHFSGYWGELLYADFGVMPPTHDLTQMFYDMNRRAGIDDEQALRAKTPASNDAPKVLSQVTAPTLLIWGTADATTPQENAEAFALWLTRAPSLIRKYPHAGRYPFVEFPKQVDGAIADFLSGALDGEMRVPAANATVH